MNSINFGFSKCKQQLNSYFWSKLNITIYQSDNVLTFNRCDMDKNNSNFN